MTLHDGAHEHEAAPLSTPLPQMDASEETFRTRLLTQAASLPLNHAESAANARRWTLAVRNDRSRLSPADAMLQAFGLATPEGAALMRLAEALLRTPDRHTAWQLICENLTAAQWRAPADAQFSVRAAATLLRWTASTIAAHESKLNLLAGAVTWAMRRGIAGVADHFIVATSVPEALARMQQRPSLALCSIDCLGESARTAAQADTYLKAYEDAIGHLSHQTPADIHLRHGISVKLSALECRFGQRFRGTYQSRLIPAMLHLARQAARANIVLTIDAEEQDRLESTLDIAAALIDDPQTQDWEGLCVAVQAYGLRALQAIDWLATRARQQGRRIAIRLVKGAYWDTEVKRAQERGLDDFPVFTDKRATDVSYLLAARHLFERRDVIHPQFATHNALTIASVRALAPPSARYEFQRLHGMGEQLYAVARQDEDFPNVRTYAPVGSHEDLLPYLIRRLLENGANTSFVRQFLDPSAPLDALLEEPAAALARQRPARISPALAASNPSLLESGS